MSRARAARMGNPQVREETRQSRRCPTPNGRPAVSTTRTEWLSRCRRGCRLRRSTGASRCAPGWRIRRSRRWHSGDTRWARRRAQPRPRVSGGHVERGNVKLTPHLHGIGLPETVPDAFPSHHGAKHGEQYGHSKQRRADRSGAGAAARPQQRDHNHGLRGHQNGAGARGRRDHGREHGAAIPEYSSESRSRRRASYTAIGSTTSMKAA